MAEMLLAVGIVVVLAAVSFIGVYAYQRSMYQLEYDGIAREIFFTAQNHLTLADSQGLVKKVSEADSGKKADSYITLLDSKSRDNVFFYAVPEGDSGGVLELMLPSMSVDTGNSSSGGGSYFVVYQKSSATVLEVFYSPISGRFGHQYEENNYTNLMNNYRGDANKAKRRNATDYGGAILGYYGGEGDGIDKEPIEIPDPSLFVENKEKLTVTIKNPTVDRNGKDIREYLTLELVVIGETSGEKKTITLYSHGADETHTYHGNPSNLGYVDINTENTKEIIATVVLDDITDKDGHFAQIFSSFIPGENLSIQAICTSSNAIVLKPGISNTARTNSLFADPPLKGGSNTDTDVQYSEVEKGLAAIEYFRHLENLDGTISNLGNNDNTFHITKAAQIEDLDWNQSKTDLTTIVPISGTESEEGCYLPVTPRYSDGTGLALAYDGQRHDIKNVEINFSSDAGLFGKISKDGTKLENLRLIDFNVMTSGGNAGTLLGAGIAETDFEIHDVVAYSSTNSRKVQNTGTGTGGGLIGSMSAGTIEDCGAAVYVTSGGAAGGLIGTTSGTEVTQSYCGGYTRQIFDISTGITAVEKDILITGTGAAGGLIGSMSGGKVEKCAAGVLVNGGTNAGGLIGESSTGIVSESYAAGHTYSRKPSGNPEIKYNTHPSVYPSRYYDADNNPIYNVNASSGSAGGLIGRMNGGKAVSCYSTCSASGTTAGGFVGSFVGTGTDDSISGSYCTGLVSGTTEGAFAGSLSGTATECKYFEIINERQNVDENDKTIPGYHYLTAQGGDKTSAGITAFDDTAATYETFCGDKDAWQKAEPYDNALKQFYHDDENKPLYNLQTVKQLGGASSDVTTSDFVATHYGDWPAPEEFIFN